MMKEDVTEKRSEPRDQTGRYTSVEFMTNDTLSLHVFPIYNVSSKGIGIIVKRNSTALEYLEVGKIMDAKFRLSKPGSGYEKGRVEIKHISEDTHNRFKGHYLIGLLILE